MAWWITIYCTRPTCSLTGDELLAGIRDRDPAAPAGVDYFTLAEDYHGVADDASPALKCLRAEPHGALPVEVAIHYTTPESRPLVVHCWNQPERVAEELAESRDVRTPPPSAEETLTRCCEVVAIELGASQFGTMGVVFAYELARYLAQKGAGIFVDDENEWYAVRDGALAPMDS